MIEKRPEAFSDIVDRAMGELRSSPVPLELPSELLDALLQAARENTGAVQRTVEASAQAEIIHPTLLTHSLDNWRWIMRSPVSRIAAAVVFVVAITGVFFWLHTGGATVSFAEVVERFLMVKSYKMKMTDQLDGNIFQTYDSMWIAPGCSRFEFKNSDGGIERVVITEGTKGLYFSPKEKVAEITEVFNLPDQAPFFDEAHSLMLKAREKTVEAVPLGEKVIDGRQAIGYRLKIEKYSTQQDIWADAKTLLPVRIEITTVQPDKAGKTSAKKVLKSIWSDIQYNLELDESLFSLDPPVGYKVVKHQPVVLPKQPDGKAKESAPMNSETLGVVGVEEKWSEEKLWGEKKGAADAKKDESKSKESVPGTLVPMGGAKSEGAADAKK